MLSGFSQPRVVICILCRGAVSVRKGDRTRFYNHISLDHEVHYDLDLFYSLSYMTAAEKDTVKKVMQARIQDGGQVALEESFLNDQHETTLEESELDTLNEQDTAEDQSENTTDDSNTTNAKCKRCDVKLPIAAIKTHMKLKHSAEEVKPGFKACPICQKHMKRASLGRHMKRTHTEQDRDNIVKIKSEKKEFVAKKKAKLTNKTEANENDDGSLRKCKICFKMVKFYNKHLLVHSKSKIGCPLCYHKFTRKDNLFSHINNTLQIY